jgi:hypothetical protein
MHKILLFGQELWRRGDDLCWRHEARGQHPRVAPRPEGPQQRGHRGGRGRRPQERHQGGRCCRRLRL